MMTPLEIKKIIAEELKVEPNLKTVFGLDLTQCLIEPTRQKYIEAIDNTNSEELWTVLEESLDRNGYKIFFDEEANMFGLGMKSKDDELINIGYYGSFLKTLYSM